MRERLPGGRQLSLRASGGPDRLANRGFQATRLVAPLQEKAYGQRGVIRGVLGDGIDDIRRTHPLPSRRLLGRLLQIQEDQRGGNRTTLQVVTET